jgi:hypothetical protein
VHSACPCSILLQQSQLLVVLVLVVRGVLLRGVRCRVCWLLLLECTAGIGTATAAAAAPAPSRNLQGRWPHPLPRGLASIMIVMVCWLPGWQASCSCCMAAAGVRVWRLCCLVPQLLRLLLLMQMLGLQRCS